LNYSKSVARPSIRELNDAGILDNEFRTLIYGNSDLKTAHVANYDFRTECYFKNGDFVSTSFFYKDFINHIEASFGSGGLTWNNVGRSYVRGIELEGKKSLGKHFEFRSNVTIVKSNSQVIRSILEVVDGKKEYTAVDTLNRPMYGQAPYIVNTVLTYKADSIGLTASLSYNTQGPRLVIAGILSGYLDVYEMQRHLIDAKISKTLGRYFIVSLTVRDLLNAPVRRAYKMPGEYKDYDRFRYGTNYLLSVTYRLK
jgi:outer membrane receptor protein involved in Fe transport